MTDKQLETKATFTCPKCGFKKEEEMPTNRCLHAYTCTNCSEMITPKGDDCCVFCSYADKNCPDKQ